ncbi:MAG TPA: adenylate/guanylate cyclase domain-containing protein [Xanthobacteraceae bacterium]|jgi:class 3 adenylate cyclase/predicted ATPase
MTPIAEWLGSLGLSEYADRFAENRIDLSILRDLTDQDLKDLGVVLGDRRRILRAIAELAGTVVATSELAAAAELKPRDEAERRQVTVMFSDLVGSAALASCMDPEDLREIVSAFQKCVAEIVNQFGGFVAQYMGDGVLLYFGYPQAQEDDAERAVRAGLALITAAAGVETRAPLRIRVGIATGLVVVGDLIGAGEARERRIVGETPNLAARLQEIAEPDTVVIAEGTRRLLGNLFEVEDLGLRSLKGFPGAVRAWAVLRASSVASHFEALRTPGLTALVGREEEIELLLRRWSKAKTGEGQVVLLSGEPGIGKSRLTVALRECLADEPHTHLRYFCSSRRTSSALYPIIGQIERAVGLAHDDTPQARLDKLDAMLAKTSTSTQDAALFAEMLSLPNDGRYPALELSPQQCRQRTLDALNLQMEALSRSGPVLMIFEDVHWIDPTSLEALGRAADKIRTLRALLIVTYRPEFEPPWIGRPHVTVCTIGRLAQRDVDAMIDQVVGDKPLPVSIRRDIIKRTDGIPLFVEEITKAVLETESEDEARRTAALVPSSAPAVPATLHASLMARLDRLGLAKELAQIGAAIGRRFSHALLAAVVCKSEPELGSGLDRLIQAGLLYRQGMPPALTTYVFKHALVRDAAEDMLLRARRKELHDKIARALEAGFPEIVEAQPELIAHHYREADNVVKAVNYLSIAGVRALSRSALNEAREHITRALKLISGLPEDDTRRRDELKLRIALARTLLEQRGYADQQVGEAYTEARNFAKRMGDAGMYLAALYGLWSHNYVRGRPDAILNQAKEFLAFAHSHNEAGAIMVGHRLVGTSCLINGYIAGAGDALQEALVRYHPGEHGAASPGGQSLRARFGQDVGVAIHSYRSWALCLSGQPADAEKAAQAALERSQELEHDNQSRFYALWHAGMAYVLLRNADKIAETGNKLMELANARELPYWQALGHFLHGWHVRLAGRPEDAVALLQEGLRLWQQTGSRVFRPICLAFLADAYAAGGKPDLAHHAFEEALRIVTETGERWAEPEIHRLFGDLFAQYGPPATAIARYERAIAIARRQESRSFELRATTSLARVMSDQGRSSEAHDLLLDIYRTFDADCDTADLADAKILLEATNT